MCIRDRKLWGKPLSETLRHVLHMFPDGRCDIREVIATYLELLAQRQSKPFDYQKFLNETVFADSIVEHNGVHDSTLQGDAGASILFRQCQWMESEKLRFVAILSSADYPGGRSCMVGLTVLGGESSVPSNPTLRGMYEFKWGECMVGYHSISTKHPEKTIRGLLGNGALCGGPRQRRNA